MRDNEKNNFLENLIIGKWEKIALQGILDWGESFNNNHVTPNIYFYYRRKWIDIGIIETVKDEVFDLYCGVMDYSPIPEPNIRNKPPRKLVTKFPTDCPLDELMEHGVKAIKYNSYTFNNDKEVIIKGDLEIISQTGKRFILSPSYSELLFFEIYCPDS